MKIRGSEGVSKTNNGLILTTLRRMIWLNQRSIEGYVDASVLKSRMMGDYHVQFCERFRGEIPLYLLDLFFLDNPSKYYCVLFQYYIITPYTIIITLLDTFCTGIEVNHFIIFF